MRGAIEVERLSLTNRLQRYTLAFGRRANKGIVKGRGGKVQVDAPKWKMVPRAGFEPARA
jgi:hypothetical protein